jgi:hypothetical protein
VVAPEKWGRIINIGNKTAPQLADEVKSALDQNVTFVAINEIAKTTEERIAEAANLIGPGYANRWGCYIEYGSAEDGPSYPNRASAIDAVYRNHGTMLPELYIGYRAYWRSSNTDAERDDWMNKTFFKGPGKLSWLRDRKETIHLPDDPSGSKSRINPIFSASDAVLTSEVEANNNRFLDRIFYVFCGISPFQELFLRDNGGGAGSYLWEANSEWGQRNAERDHVFQLLWNRYAVEGHKTPNWSGPMPAP